MTTEPHRRLASRAGLLVLHFAELASIPGITSVRYHRQISSWVSHSVGSYRFNKQQQVPPERKKEG